jgi:hypothetical protein
VDTGPITRMGHVTYSPVTRWAVIWNFCQLALEALLSGCRSRMVLFHEWYDFTNGMIRMKKKEKNAVDKRNHPPQSQSPPPPRLGDISCAPLGLHLDGDGLDEVEIIPNRAPQTDRANGPNVWELGYRGRGGKEFPMAQWILLARGTEVDEVVRTVNWVENTVERLEGHGDVLARNGRVRHGMVAQGCTVNVVVEVDRMMAQASTVNMVIGVDRMVAQASTLNMVVGVDRMVTQGSTVDLVVGVDRMVAHGVVIRIEAGGTRRGRMVVIYVDVGSGRHIHRDAADGHALGTLSHGSGRSVILAERLERGARNIPAIVRGDLAGTAGNGGAVGDHGGGSVAVRRNLTGHHCGMLSRGKSCRF